MDEFDIIEARMNALPPRILSDGSALHGKKFKGDLLNGKGVHKKEGVFKYIGPFENSKKNGRGYYELVGQYSYKGGFTDGRKDGYGEIKYTDKKLTMKGQWKLDKILTPYDVEYDDTYNISIYESDGANGLGFIQDKTGKLVYEGQIANSYQKHGRGIFYKSEDKKIDGTFLNDEANGYAHVIGSDFSYKGELKNSKYHGEGILYKGTTSEIKEQGVFEDGRLVQPKQVALKNLPPMPDLRNYKGDLETKKKKGSQYQGGYQSSGGYGDYASGMNSMGGGIANISGGFSGSIAGGIGGGITGGFGGGMLGGIGGGSGGIGGMSGEIGGMSGGIGGMSGGIGGMSGGIGGGQEGGISGGYRNSSEYSSGEPIVRQPPEPAKHTEQDILLPGGYFIHGTFPEPGIKEQVTVLFPSGIEYTGKLVNNKAEGQGTIMYSEISYFKGSFKRNKKHGEGTYLGSEEIVGNWIDGKMDGIFEITFGNSDKYIGMVSQDFLHGEGLYIWQDGSSYSGMFAKNMRHGYGELKQMGLGCYIGDWKYDKFDGYGKMVYENGETYDGEWKEGKYNGIGVYIRKDGSSFIVESTYEMLIKVIKIA